MLRRRYGLILLFLRVYFSLRGSISPFLIHICLPKSMDQWTLSIKIRKMIKKKLFENIRL